MAVEGQSDLSAGIVAGHESTRSQAAWHALRAEDSGRADSVPVGIKDTGRYMGPKTHTARQIATAGPVGGVRIELWPLILAQPVESQLLLRRGGGMARYFRFGKRPI